MVLCSALLMVLGAAAAATVAATVDGLLVMGQDGRWSNSDLVPVGQRTALLLLGSGLPEGPDDVGFTPRDAARGSSCDQEQSLQMSALDSNGSVSVALPWYGRWYVCLRRGDAWIHQGPAVSLTA